MSSEISIEEGRLPSTSLGTGPSASLAAGKPAATETSGRLKPASTSVGAGPNQLNEPNMGVGFSRVNEPNVTAGPSRVNEPYVGAGFSRPDDGFQPWHFFVLVSILLATVAVIMARQSAPEHLILISFTIAAAGAAAGAFYRMLAPLMAPVVLQMGEPVSERTRAALEREKLLVLRSIKDLEFDRAMGKLSQKDFDEMAGRLRARAMSLMKQLDLGAAGYGDAIEQELTGRLQRQGRLKPAATIGSGSEGRIPSASLGARSPAVTSGCRSCRATNDPDAVFCKKCGTRLQA